MTRSTQILCVRLIQWPIDRIRRRSPELRHEPLVIIETIGNRQLVADACARSRQLGIRAGMTLAEARVLVPGLLHIPHDPQQDQRALNALGRWMMRFSPVVAVWPPDSLMIDVTGCAGVFKGLDALMNQVAESFLKMKIHARLAIAPTPTAAWAIASFGVPGHIISTDSLIETLSPLPPAALRIDPAAAAMLKQLGVDTIAQLRALPREALPARFGSELLRQLDRALGRSAEPLVSLEYHTRIEAGIEFEAEIDALDTILHVLRTLLSQVVRQLTERGCGVRLLRARFQQRDFPPIDKTIRLSRPTRKANVLFNLLRCAVETVKSETGFIGIRLDAMAFERISEEQLLLQESDEQIADDELHHLIEILDARLGPRSILQAEIVELHLPEKAHRRVEPQNITGVQIPPAVVRPLRLFHMPIQINAMASPLNAPMSFNHEGIVHRLDYVDGPERISGMWWEGRDKTRDYFDVENETGQRFWLFRVVETGRWYLHGLFS